MKQYCQVLLGPWFHHYDTEAVRIEGEIPKGVRVSQTCTTPSPGHHYRLRGTESPLMSARSG